VKRSRQQTAEPATFHIARELAEFEIKTPAHRTHPVDHLVVRPERVLVRPDRRERGALAPDASEHVIIADLTIPEQVSPVTLTEADRQGAVLYPEWNCQLQTYLPEWCALRDRPLPKGRPQYVDEVLARYHGQAVTLRRQFEALRQDPKKLRRQPEGEEIDVDAVVEALADLRAGLSPRENWYATKRTRRRDIAVAFLVDLSGSTGGWLPNGRRIIDVEKEALVLLCEALQILDDRYAIFGFTSSTRRQCDFFTVKAFDETYDETVKARLAGLDTFSYTRMGPAIRHATRLLAALDARVRLLLLITDGKPNDFDGYTGVYAVEDTRQALLEAAQLQVRTFCLTIDSQARQYMPWMFGEGNYTVVDNVATLPVRLPNLYRVLTTT
jgi:nitric oxide reductase NorD protein